MQEKPRDREEEAKTWNLYTTWLAQLITSKMLQQEIDRKKTYNSKSEDQPWLSLQIALWSEEIWHTYLTVPQLQFVTQ